jgi:glycosyltransferase involved in cell wall biosynthesis
LLFPIDWPEPFGLVMIEAMACGTPVIAWNHGSVAEIIDEGMSGYIVNSMKEAIAAAGKMTNLERSVVRNCFDQRFSAQRMTKDYIKIYQKLINKNKIASIADEKTIPISKISSAEAI